MRGARRGFPSLARGFAALGAPAAPAAPVATAAATASAVQPRPPRHGSSEADRGILLCVPFAENREAKDAGARWDPQRRRWYAPPFRPELLERWGAVYLDVPLSEKGVAKAGGARFDTDRKLWYACRAQRDLVSKWELCHLHIPVEERGQAKELGATWDGTGKRWCTNRSNSLALEKWTPVYLEVPFVEKDEAKTMGAFWDKHRNMWYTHRENRAAVDRWPRRVVALKGEERDFGGNLLFVDMVPSTCWFTNARTALRSCDWDRIRHHVYERAGYRCETCHTDGSSPSADERDRLECHERWRYDRVGWTQRLVRLVALCSKCHEATHMKLADSRGYGARARSHLQVVSGMQGAEVDAHVDAAYGLFEERSQHAWHLDVSLLSDSGFEVLPPPRGQDRALLAEQRLAEALERERPAEPAVDG